MSCIKNRFDQPDLRKYVVLQEIFLKAIKDQPWDDELREVCSFDIGDTTISTKAQLPLEPQLPLLLPTTNLFKFDLKNVTVYDLLKLLQELNC